MRKKGKMTPEEEARSEELRRMLVARIERGGGKVPETEAESEELMRRVGERIEERKAMERALEEHRAQRRRASS
jgi:hypothetical protein